VGGVLVVDDFAHHPTAVTATIQAARARWPERRIWAVLEPRSNSMRRKIFQEALPKALALADLVVLGGVFRAQQLGDENRMDPESVAASVRSLGKDAKVFEGAAAIADEIAANSQPRDLILIMSNGSSGRLRRQSPRLRSSEPARTVRCWPFRSFLFFLSSMRNNPV
jgi:UDP-N-acetylmuramate: L-alanyl-gamma-D-glutamyl-meso-diaminopimelate ligase